MICVYTLMEERLKLVVDWEVVNSQETGGKSANMQGAKKVSFTACHSGKLKLACTSPQVISTSPKTFFD